MLQNDNFSKSFIWGTGYEFFLFCRKVMFRFQDIQVFIFLTISWFTKSVMSWWVLVLETVHFWITTHTVTKLDWLRYKQGQQFSGICWTIWRTGATFCVLFNSATYSNYSITSHVTIPMFHFFEKVNRRQLKMVNVNY